MPLSSIYKHLNGVAAVEGRLKDLSQ